MSFADEKDGGQRRKGQPSPREDAIASEKPKKKRGSSPEVGNALRAAYDRAVEEAIPPEMLDLLGKLG